jgi:hypothetical protein
VIHAVLFIDFILKTDNCRGFQINNVFQSRSQSLELELLAKDSLKGNTLDYIYFLISSFWVIRYTNKIKIIKILLECESGLDFNRPGLVSF